MVTNGKDIWLRMLIPFIFIIISLLGNNIIRDGFTTEKLLQLLEVSIMMIFAFEMNWFISMKIRKVNPGLLEIRKRFLKTYLLCYVFNLLFILTTFYIHNIILPNEKIDLLSRLKSTATETFLITLIIVLIYEAAYSYKRLLKTEKEKEELTRMHLQSQYDSLKGQVNPHFLFNSLNSLRQLILKDQQQAASYVEQLSDVYRYLLRSNESDLTTLKKELDFIDSYNHLLKTRFGNGYQPVINVNENYYDHLIPPLTLQMLVENAVKHNIISVNQPLLLTITTIDGKLHVKNNLQKKNQSIPSDKMGLANILTKYQLLNQDIIEISETENEFTVVLPLIKKEENADINN